RLPERRLHAYLARVLQPGHGVKPAPANDSDRRRRSLAALFCPHCCHASPPKPLAPITTIRPIRCAPKYRSPPKMDPSFFPPLPPPTASTAPRLLLPPAPAATSAIPAIRSTAASNAPRACVCAPRSLRNACETARSSPRARRFPCSP